MGELEKYINLVPNVTVKKQVLLDDDVSIRCRLCSKGFVSELAINNHARMEHIDAYASGDPSVWTEVREKPAKPPQPQPNVIKIKKEKSDTSNYLMALASNDVSYIIIKDDSQVSKKRKVENMLRRERVEKPAKTVPPKKEKPQEPITGPFECLQPSTLVAEGTCHQIFFSCCEYSVHHRDEHTRRRKGLRCQVCEKPLACSGGEEPAPYSCEVCGTGYQSNKELSEHMAISHVKLKPFQCSICHKRFTQQGGVQQHMRMHTGDRPFPCSFCHKAFTQKSGLEQHLRIHTKVKPYRCVVCNKTFCQSVHLKQHMRTHTHVAPFQCTVCEKRFKQSSHLNYHLKNHNPAVEITDEQRAKFVELIGTIESEGHIQIESEVDAQWCVHNEEMSEVSEEVVDMSPVEQLHEADEDEDQQ